MCHYPLPFIRVACHVPQPNNESLHVISQHVAGGSAARPAGVKQCGHALLVLLQGGFAVLLGCVWLLRLPCS